MKSLLVVALGFLVYLAALEGIIRLAVGQDSFVAREDYTLRMGPGIEFQVIDALKKGTKLKPLNKSDSWYRVQLPDGRRGWIDTAHPVAASEKAPAPPDSPKIGERPLPPSEDKDVYVRGYYRKDGTYVQPHYRSRPSRK